jgi:hypothetical protein
MSNADIVYTSALDDDEVLAALKRIDKGVDRVAENMNKAFSKAGDSASKSGVQIGAVSGVVGKLTERFIDLGRQAAQAFLGVIEAGITLNREAQNLSISLTNIFKGNEDAALSFISLVDEAAVRLGADQQELRELGKALLPDVGDINTTIDLLTNAVILGKDANQSAVSTRIALDEALSGNLSSLRRRLNLQKRETEEIERLSENMSVAAAISQVLADRVERVGLSVEAFGDTFDVRLATIQSIARQLNLTFTSEIFEVFRERMGGALDVLEQQGPAIEDAAAAFGDVVAVVADFVATGLIDFIAGIDFERVQNLAAALFAAADKGLLLVDVLFDLGETEDGLDGVASSLEVIAGLLEQIAQLAAVAKASFAALQPFAAAAATGGLAPGLDLSVQGIGERFTQSIEESAEALDRSNQRIEEQRERLKARNEEAERGTDVDISLGDPLKEAADEAEAAQEAIAEGQADLAEELGERLLDIQTRFERQRTEDAIKNAERRTDIARRNADKLEDIARKNADQIERGGHRPRPGRQAH